MLTRRPVRRHMLAKSGEILPKAVRQEQRGAAWCQHLCDLIDQTLRHGQGVLTDVNGQDELADRVHRHTHSAGQARQGQVLDRLGLGDLIVFNGTEQGDQFVHLDLFDVDILQNMAGEGFEVLGCFDQPAQHYVRIDLKDPRSAVTVCVVLLDRGFYSVKVLRPLIDR